MAPTKYIVLDPDEGRLAQQPGQATYAGSLAAGKLVALTDDGVIDPELLASGGDMINPMTDAGDLIYAAADTSGPYTNRATPGYGASTVAVESTFSSYVSSQAIDSDDSTYWSSANHVNIAWLALDLGVVHTITGYRLLQTAHTLEGYASEWVLEISDDAGSTWTTILTVTSAPDDSGQVAITPTAARYWRLRATTGSGYGWGINSAELYTQDTVGLARLPIGDEAQVLTVVDGLPVWANATSGGGTMDNPMTAIGDLIVGGEGTGIGNVALTSLDATATSNRSIWTGAFTNILDGDDSTALELIAPNAGTYVDIALPLPRSIFAFRLLHTGTEYRIQAETLYIESSDNAVTWTLRHTWANPTFGGDPESGEVALDSGPIDARYWRFRLDDADTGYYGWGLKSLELRTTVGTPDGTPTRLPIGDETQVLTVVAGAPAWSRSAIPTRVLARLTGDGSTTTFSLPSTAATSYGLMVFTTQSGVLALCDPDDYAADADTDGIVGVIFDTAPAAGVIVVEYCEP